MNRLFDAIVQSLEIVGLVVSDKLTLSSGEAYHGTIRLTRQVTEGSDDWFSTTEIARFHIGNDNTITLRIHNYPSILYSASDPDSIEKLVKTVKDEYDRVLAEPPLVAAYRDAVGISMKNKTVQYTLSGVHFGV